MSENKYDVITGSKEIKRLFSDEENKSEIKDNNIEFFIKLKEDKNLKRFFILLLCILSIVPIFFSLLKLFEGIIFGIIIWLIDILVFLIDKYLNPKQIKLKKIQNNLKIEYLNSKSHNLMSKKLINKISNIHFELFKKDGYLNLFLMYDYNDNIDLNSSNIKNIPLKLFESFFPINDEYDEEIEIKLNNFINKSSINLKKNFLSKNEIIEINNHFTTLFLESPFEENYYMLCLFLIIPIICLLYYFNDLKFYSVLFIIIIICLLNIIILYGRKHILRIDFITSEERDKIFIGLIRFISNSYYKTFLIEKNEIEKINVENKDLKIIFKDKKEEIIYSFNKLFQNNLNSIIQKINIINQNLLSN